MDARGEITEATERLYRQFANYPLRASFIAWPAEVEDGDARRLMTKPLRTLTADELQPYVFEALVTWGDADDYRHFVPRIFELLAQGWKGSTWDESAYVLAFRALRVASWNGWPPEEREAVEQYLHGLWRSLLNDYPAFAGADACLCGIAQATDDLQPFLDAWRDARSPASLRHLAAFVGENANGVLLNGKLQRREWLDARPRMQQVIAWLAAPSVGAAFEDAYLELPDGGDDLATALDVMSTMRSRMLSGHASR